jgi:hypothetical protein
MIADDNTVACTFCFDNRGEIVPATKLAPQFSGGDDDRPAEWVPVCEMHFDDWYEDIDEPNRLPWFRLDGATWHVGITDPSALLKDFTNAEILTVIKGVERLYNAELDTDLPSEFGHTLKALNIVANERDLAFDEDDSRRCGECDAELSERGWVPPDALPEHTLRGVARYAATPADEWLRTYKIALAKGQAVLAVWRAGAARGMYIDLSALAV